jgi:hypothetical protein
MMSKFIELHDNETKSPISININNIADFHVDYDGQTAVDVGRDAYLVAESYDEIKNLIKDAGVLIHKADPRLNLTTPLTMDDLREMIGEPIWNSNNGKWYLMLKVREDLDPELAVVQDSDAKIDVFSPEELIKFPLYRMKQEAE